ncbi:FAD-dependent oxidoreductase [Naasia sp. SYSU D00057]|uniref:FAD-dependent oxidoreductase n=1 Tax=Naasia sp. SYSU D00057 TaxID=2817380 RepID=UPI001B318357|nr:FAD-dependent oxidoreductase [Naasia sp. SYSU D00057]
MTLLDLTVPRPRSSRLDGLPIAIIGAGPIGLAAAAELLERGLDFAIYEAGEKAGDAVASWGHIRLFSPWRQLVDPAARRLLVAAGWREPAPEALPTGADLVSEYLAPLAALPEIASRLVTGAAVVGVSREGMDRTRSTGRAATPFLLRLSTADGVEEVTARAVIDASGTYRTPNSLGSSGLDPLGIEDVRDRITSAMPDVHGAERQRFAGRRVAVVGAGHSAAGTLLNLAALAEEEPGTEVVWVIRNASAVRIRTSADDELQVRASLGSRLDALVERGAIKRVDGFEIVRLGKTADGRVEVVGRRGNGLERIEVDVVVNATGFRPDLDMLREVRLELDEIVEAPKRLAPLIDPNVHTCGTVEPHGFAELQQPEPDFFLAGMKSYGRAPTFLLATGYEQVRSIVAWLAGDAAAARDVRLTLPATGVCSTNPSGGSSCC